MRFTSCLPAAFAPLASLLAIGACGGGQTAGATSFDPFASSGFDPLLTTGDGSGSASGGSGTQGSATQGSGTHGSATKGSGSEGSGTDSAGTDSNTSNTSSAMTGTATNDTTTSGTATTMTTGVPMATTTSGPTSGMIEDPDFKFDVGGKLDIGFSLEPQAGCTKADFLFVVDNSASMAGEQTSLISAFPAFIAAIRNQANIDDFRILVTSTGETSYPASGCGSSLGAGKSAGADGSCFQSPRCYIDHTQPNLDATFACLGKQGITGDPNEKAMNAMERAIGVLTNPGSPNESFVRDDAILIITVISDEEEDPLVTSGEGRDGDSSGNPASWKTSVLTAKGGGANAEDAVVVLALVGDQGEGKGGICKPFGTSGGVGAIDAVTLRQFANSFKYGTWGSVCAADYGPFFVNAISRIKGACEAFVPPG